MPGNPAAQRWRDLTREQKLSVGVLGVCGLVAIAFSIVRIRTAIIRPFTTPVQLLVELKKQYGPTSEELAEQQKKTDTDGDGVSDYLELNVYKTSPYLRDSDSDGDPDNQEIAQGTNPNCPKGKTCVSSIEGTDAPKPLSPNMELPGTAGAPGAAPGSLPPREPAAVRAWLERLGFTRTEIANFSDAQLLEAYDSAVREEAAKQQTEQTAGSATSAAPQTP